MDGKKHRDEIIHLLDECHEKNEDSKREIEMDQQNVLLLGMMDFPLMPELEEENYQRNFIDMTMSTSRVVAKDICNQLLWWMATKEKFM